jgi:hypothetical protein
MLYCLIYLYIKSSGSYLLFYFIIRNVHASANYEVMMISEKTATDKNVEKQHSIMINVVLQIYFQII